MTNAPIIGVGFQLGGAWYGIGDSVAIPAGEDTLRAQITLRSNTPVDHLELVHNGKVILELPLRGERTRADTLVDVPVNGSGWYVVRAYANRPRLPVLDLYPFASTSPFYVTSGSQPIRSADDAAYFVKWIDRVTEEVEKHTGWNSATEKESVLERIAQARAEFVSRGGPASGR